MSLNTQYPAQSYMISQKVQKEETLYKEWISEIPRNWIQHFIKNGLIPFLNKYGYVIAYDVPTVCSFFKEWAFIHVLMKHCRNTYTSRTFLQCAHNGGSDEKDWYMFLIPSDGWFDLSKEWASNEFLDDSEAGQSQQYDLCEFVWNMIHLSSSKSHMKWLQHMDILEYQEDDTVNPSNIAEEHVVYGGERK
jgi:hypothetical protein